MLLNNFYNLCRLNATVYSSGKDYDTNIPAGKSGLVDMTGAAMAYYSDTYEGVSYYKSNLYNKVLLTGMNFVVGTGKTEPAFSDYDMNEAFSGADLSMTWSATMNNGRLLLNFYLSVYNKQSAAIEISEFGLVKYVYYKDAYTGKNVLLTRTQLGDNAIILQPQESKVINYIMEW